MTIGGDYSQGYVQVAIDGVVLTDLAESTEPAPEGDDVTAILAGGRRAVGQNFSTLANEVNLPVKITYPSADFDFLAKLAQSKRKVDYVWRYVDPSEFPDGEMTSFVTRGRLVRQSHTKGETSDPRDFMFKGVGFTMEFKNKPPLTVS